jgi:hypothetical protein
MIGDSVTTGWGFQTMTRVILHEWMHMLGFSTSLYRSWKSGYQVTYEDGRYLINSGSVR